MKQTSKDEKARISQLLDDMLNVKRTEAQQMYREVEQYLTHVDAEKHPQERIRILLGLARYWVFAKDIDKILDLMQEAQSLALRHELKPEMQRIRSVFAVAHSMSGDNLKAIYTWEDMLEEMEGPDEMWVSVVNNLIVAYANTTQFTKAVDLSYQALEVLDKDDDPEVRVFILLNLGNSYRPLKKYEKSLEVYAEALVLAEKLGKHFFLCYIYGNMCNSLSDLKRYDEALKYAYKALELQKRYYPDEHVAETMITIADTMLKLERYAEAESHLERALSILSDRNQSQIASARLSLGQLYLVTQRYDQALDNIKMAYDLSHDLEITQIKLSSTELMADYYVEVGEFEESVKYFKLLTELQEEQFTEISEKMISRQEAEYLRHKIEEQGESYRLKNVELEASNILINRQAKALKKSNKELQNSMTMLNRLISVISHDVRGPVASSAAALRMITESRLDESTRDELLRNMLDTLDSTADLLTEIMIWIESRSYSTSIERLMRKVDMNSLLQNVIKLYSGQIIQKQISLKLDLRDEICEAYTEPNTMKIVLRNIISNAVKFTPEAGQISIFCAPVQDYIQIRIKDNGCGMSKEEIDKLLKQKMHSQKGSCQEIGMGMGLRLSLGYLKLLDAELKIASVPQQGSEFIINIRREK